MDFGISEDQVLLKDSVRKFLEAECPTTRVRDIMESDSGHDAELWQGFADLGLTALPIAEAFGGAGLEVLDLALIAEELGFACTPGPFLANALGTIAETLAPANRCRKSPRHLCGRRKDRRVGS